MLTLLDADVARPNVHIDQRPAAANFSIDAPARLRTLHWLANLDSSAARFRAKIVTAAARKLDSCAS